jgi:hypothetical protein
MILSLEPKILMFLKFPSDWHYVSGQREKGLSILSRCLPTIPLPRAFLSFLVPFTPFLHCPALLNRKLVQLISNPEMRVQLVLSSLAATALAVFQYKPAPGGIMSGCADTVTGTFELIRAAPGALIKRDAPYPYEGQVRHPL